MAEKIYICSEGHRWKGGPGFECPYCNDLSVKEWEPDYVDLPESFVKLVAESMAAEISFMKAPADSWDTLARGVLTKIVRSCTSNPPRLEEVTAEEVHLMDLITMSIVDPSLNRIERLHVLVDQIPFWKEVSKTLGASLEQILESPNHDEAKEIAKDALETAAWMIRG